MRRVSLAEFRKNAKTVLHRIQQGERYVLTRHGQPVARMEPLAVRDVVSEDPIYHLGELAANGGEALSNHVMDRIIYGA